MPVSTSYLNTTKNIHQILDAIKKASVPPRFTNQFLKQLGFGSSGDRPTLGVLKALGFLSDSGEPTDRYRRFRDPAASPAVMAEAMRDAYEDLFAIDQQAYEQSSTELKGAFARITGKGDAVTQKMAATFKVLSEVADFSAIVMAQPTEEEPEVPPREEADPQPQGARIAPPIAQLDGAVLSLKHDVHVHLPATTDIGVYNAIFQSLKDTLL